MAKISQIMWNFPFFEEVAHEAGVSGYNVVSGYSTFAIFS